jgi:hypothetical protein
MEFQYFINNYWKTFISYLCEFHKLEEEFISKYEYELDWNSLSTNQALDWNKLFLKKYEDLLLWHELAWNPSIVWTEELIDMFKKRLDWYYLGRNINLPLSEKFIQKYLKNIFIIENNKFLTSEIKNKYSQKILPRISHKKQELKKFDLTKLETILNEDTYYHNQEVIYKEYILPNIQKEGLDIIFEQKFDYSQRYFYIDAIQVDVHGLTPEYNVGEKNPFEKFVDARGLLTIKDTLKVKYGSLQEGPDRLYEVPRLSGMSYYSILLVSENIKTVLESFKLPNYKFHPVEIQPKKIKTRTKFYIFQLEYDTIKKDLDYQQVKLSYRTERFGNVSAFIPITNSITSYNELLEIKKQIKKTINDVSSFVEIHPDQYLINGNYDIFSYDRDIIVTEFVKQKLEEFFPNQMRFRSAQSLKIKINQDLYEAKRKNYSELVVHTNRLFYSQSPKEKFFYDKLERLEKVDTPIPLDLIEKDEFSNKEIELKIVLSKKFKELYRKNQKVGEYTMLSITEFNIKNEYSTRSPETFKSVIVAENGCGDYLGLILEEKSDYMMRDELYEFFHETGEVKKYKNLKLGKQ